MNIEAYISSGILESYALGLCSTAEKLELEGYLLQYPELADELRLVEESLGLFAEAGKIEPPKALKANIWAAIQADEAGENEATIEAPFVQPSTPTAEAPIIPMRKTNWVNVAASAAVIISLGYGTLHFYQEGKEKDAVLARLQADKDKMEAEKQDMNKNMQMMLDADNKKVILAGTESNPDFNAVVFWNAKEEKVMLGNLNLPKAPEGKQYQLWALMDGKPIDAGVFDAQDPTAMLEMKKIGNSQAFAVTVEPMGGSESPHLETLCLIGNV